MSASSGQGTMLALIVMTLNNDPLLQLVGNVGNDLSQQLLRILSSGHLLETLKSVDNGPLILAGDSGHRHLLRNPVDQLSLDIHFHPHPQ